MRTNVIELCATHFILSFSFCIIICPLACVRIIMFKKVIYAQENNESDIFTRKQCI